MTGRRRARLATLDRAKATLDSVYASYGVADRRLLRENYPFNADYKAGYLASEDQARPNPYSYLWPFGNASAVNTILEEDASYRSVLDGRVLPGLAEYLDTTRMPAAYASYINTAPASDRFYDDNVCGWALTSRYLRGYGRQEIPRPG